MLDRFSPFSGAHARFGSGPAPGPAPMTFPAQGAKFDLDFMAPQYHGGIQPDIVVAGDARMFRQSVSQSTPMFTENLDGSLVQLASGGNLRRSSRGLIVHAFVGFSEVLRNRDLSNAVWTKTGCTALLNQRGRAGANNSASLLTATTAAATVTQPIAEAGNFSLWLDVKPVTNTGGIQATTDGGATWEALDLSDVRYDGWSRASLPMRAVAAGALIGLRIPNAGDAFGIDFVQLSTVDYETSPIQTTTARARKPNDRPTTQIGNGSGLMEFIAENAVWGMYIEVASRRDTLGVYVLAA